MKILTMMSMLLLSCVLTDKHGRTCTRGLAEWDCGKDSCMCHDWCRANTGGSNANLVTCLSRYCEYQQICPGGDR